LEHVIETILSWPNEYVLPVLWAGLFVAGLGVPIPEDIFLITGGIFTEHSHGNFFFALVVLYSGVIVGDTIVYHLGARYGEAVLRRKFIARLMTPARVERVRGYYTRYGAVTVFLARHVAGLRFPTFLMAGVSHMGFWRFLFWDTISALISVPLWILLGYKMSEHWKEIHKRIEYVLWGLGAAILIFLLWKFRARLFGRKTQAPAEPVMGPPETPQP
jgi:membrane protein DedA with SNARE-associated domain